MFWFLSFLALLSHAVAAPDSSSGQRIVGGELTTIDRYPYQAALLISTTGTVFSQTCGSSILNSRSILTASHCLRFSVNPAHYRIRVGSTFANSGGVVHGVIQIIVHPSYNSWNFDNDIAMIRSTTVFSFNNLVQPAAIAGSNYDVVHNQAVWATGWGLTSGPNSFSEQLRHVQLWSVSQDICRTRYEEIRMTLTDNMICAGMLDVGGRGQCVGDSGGPLIHNGVVVGVCSWTTECGHPRYPSVNARVSRYTSWIQANA